VTDVIDKNQTCSKITRKSKRETIYALSTKSQFRCSNNACTNWWSFIINHSCRS